MEVFAVNIASQLQESSRGLCVSAITQDDTDIQLAELTHGSLEADGIDARAIFSVEGLHVERQKNVGWINDPRRAKCNCLPANRQVALIQLKLNIKSVEVLVHLGF